MNIYISKSVVEDFFAPCQRMKKTTRRSKQATNASYYADENQQDCRNRVRELEQENKAFQVRAQFRFFIIQKFWLFLFFSENLFGCWESEKNLV